MSATLYYTDSFTEALRIGIIVFASVLALMLGVGATWEHMRRYRRRHRVIDWRRDFPEFSRPKDSHVHLVEWKDG